MILQLLLGCGKKVMNELFHILFRFRLYMNQIREIEFVVERSINGIYQFLTSVCERSV